MLIDAATTRTGVSVSTSRGTGGDIDGDDSVDGGGDRGGGGGGGEGGGGGGQQVYRASAKSMHGRRSNIGVRPPAHVAASSNSCGAQQSEPELVHMVSSHCGGGGCGGESGGGFGGDCGGGDGNGAGDGGGDGEGGVVGAGSTGGGDGGHDGGVKRDDWTIGPPDDTAGLDQRLLARYTLKSQSWNGRRLHSPCCTCSVVHEGTFVAVL